MYLGAERERMKDLKALAYSKSGMSQGGKRVAVVVDAMK